ncbi:MAG: D-xylose transport system substrate-binding protein [Chloroflexota bacterium]|jgi:D-xylose transport system substrate-binding protein|nr:D-xylose transport system substrate-binding protein [Chloroflexota bacterium]MEA2607534.1 D-xylose transport system substrate-binding protein [Chloroflexota bacterium]
MITRRLAAVLASGMFILGACNSTASTAPGASGAAGASGVAATGCKVGVSWNNYSQERWKKADEPAMQKAIAAGGGSYIRADANDKAEQQLTDIDSLINQGAKALIILAKDDKGILPAIAKAKTAGIPVIAYDRLIEDESTFYITFDNKKVGTLMAQSLIKAKPAGNYAIILGAATDPNSAFLRTGMTDAGIPALNATANGIKVVFEKNTDNWDTTNAKNNMEAALNANQNKIDAVLSENDSMATGVVQALSAVGLKIPVSGQDGDTAALNRVALGTQTVSVWKNAFALGETAGSVAVQLCAKTAAAAIKAPSDLPAAAAPASLTATPFTTPGGKTVQSIILTPTAVTKDNVKDTVDAGWVTKDAVCAGVPAGSLPLCG